MAVILAESVAITKSRLAKGFNGDNLNLNGKVISAQEADNGFKAAGSVNPPYIAVIASGNQKGFAAGAVSAFNDYVQDINFNKYNAENVINKYFDDMQSVVENCGIEGGRLSVGVVCAYDDCVIAAKTGGCHLLRFSEGELFEIALSDDENGRGFQFVDVIADGDMFALIGEEASADLDYDGIVNTFDSDVDLKSMIKEFYKLLSIGARGKDCSVVLMKLKCDSERTYAATPLVIPDDDIDDDGAVSITPDAFDAEPPVETDELRKTDGYVTDDEKPETGKRPASPKKKILSFIPVAILVIILAVTAALYLATRPDNPLNEGESGTNGEQIIIENGTNDDDFNGSNGMQEVEDTELGGDVDAPVDDNTTTTRAPETTTERTTESTTQTTTEPPVDEPPVDEPPVDEPPVDEPPVDEPPVDEPPVDEPPVDEPPAEEPVGGEE
ncbi:MAG: hypothetical protein IKM66_10200 [Clostridia bacterium]|nr:hypothetical protein [Clostridia bacterium]